MGSSDKLPGSGPAHYRFVDHRHHLDALLDALGVHDRVVLVGHDWGGVLAVDWARRHPDTVRGIAYLETLVAPVSWAGPNAPDPALFGPLRGPDGERLVLAENVFVEMVLQAGTVRRLTGEEMDAYRAPYREPGSRGGRRWRGRARSRSTVSPPTSTAIADALDLWLGELRR